MYSMTALQRVAHNQRGYTMQLQKTVNKFQFQDLYGRALNIRVNGEFVIIKEKKSGIDLDWMTRPEFIEVIKTATVEESGSLLTIYY
jgi:hypothetical protein